MSVDASDLELEFVENVLDIVTRARLFERLRLDEVDLVVELVQLLEELALVHRRLQDVATHVATATTAISIADRYLHSQ